MKCEIVTAYSYSPKFKTYTCAAYVRESHHAGLPNETAFKVLCRYSMGDTKVDALTDVLSHIYRNNERHPPDMPVLDKGRLPHSVVTSFAF